jgi:type IV pilus assembly protein PilF
VSSSRITLFFVLIFIFLGCSSKRKTGEEKALLHLQLGTAHLTQGNYPLALQELLEAERLDPKNAIVKNNLGLAYMVRERYDLAQQKIKQAVELDPKYTDAKNNLGRVLMEKGQFAEAVKILEDATQDLTYQSPQRVAANLGMAYFRAKNYPRAADTLKKALHMDRANCLTATYYGRSLLELSDFARAKSALDQAIVHCKGTNFDEPYYFSAVSYLRLGDSDRASARLKEMIEKFPSGEYLNEANRLLGALK